MDSKNSLQYGKIKYRRKEECRKQSLQQWIQDLRQAIRRGEINNKKQQAIVIDFQSRDNSLSRFFDGMTSSSSIVVGQGMYIEKLYFEIF